MSNCKAKGSSSLKNLSGNMCAELKEEEERGSGEKFSLFKVGNFSGLSSLYLLLLFLGCIK